MSKPVIVEPEAEADLRAAYDWYEDQREGLGTDFVLCFEGILAAIAERPRSFPIIARRTRRALTGRFPYSVLFVELPDTITVIGVFHTSRSPSHLQHRAR